jgi:ribosomal protein S24E
MKMDEDHSFKLLNEYDLKEKITKMVRHVLAKVPESNKEQLLVNYINSLMGSAILHHDNKYVKKLPVPEFKETFGN